MMTEESIFMAPQPPMCLRRPHYRGFMIILRHTTLGRTSMAKRSARRTDLYLITHNTHKKQTSMPPPGFDPATPPLHLASERPL